MELLNDATVWVLISFIVFSIGAFKFGRQGLMAKLDGRIEEIRREIASAENLRIEAQELLAQYQRKQRDAAREAEAIIATAKKSAQEIGKQAEADLAEAMQRREQQLAERLARMEQAAIAEIREHAAELAVKATREIIAGQMDQDTNGKLIDQSIKRLNAA